MGTSPPTLRAMNERTARCLLVARVLSADGMMTDSERAVLVEAMAQHDLDDAERAIVGDLEKMAEAEALVRALPEPTRRAILDDCIQAALADGKLSPLETRAVAEISAAIGIG
jgi:uncharacterized tellurite resistance protein B-like protein